MKTTNTNLFNKKNIVSAITKWYSYYFSTLSALYTKCCDSNHFSWNGKPCSKEELMGHLLDEEVPMGDAPLSASEKVVMTTLYDLKAYEDFEKGAPSMPTETCMRIIDARKSFDYYMHLKDVRLIAEKIADYCLESVVGSSPRKG